MSVEKNDQDVINEDNEERQADDVVDPRVQIELERLNTATDDINKLEVDLDDARATFRDLLCDSTYKIDALAKKLGSCIEKSRPYYDARFKAKEALTETQKAAIRFERANSQHAAAKEMVYLAEEGLKTEGRCFDHAWQEMLNHATSRVNESERERAVCEVEHKRTTLLYHRAENDVQGLQRELKRAIAKSSMGARRSLLLINSIAYRHNLLLLPYYEMKAHFNHVLEEQKLKVSALERSVADAKTTYAEALKNLERISDEIHRTRRCDGTDNYDDKTESKRNKSKNDSSGSSTTESPDSTDYTSDEYLRLPDRVTCDTSFALPKVENNTDYLVSSKSTTNMSSTEPRRYIKRERPRSIATTEAKKAHNASTPTGSSMIPNTTDLSRILSPIDKRVKIKTPSYEDEVGNNGTQNGEEWTDISLNNSPDDVFCKINNNNNNNNKNDNPYSDEEDQIPYRQLNTDASPETAQPANVESNDGNVRKSRINSGKRLVTQKSLPATIERDDDKRPRSPSLKKKGKLDSCLATWISRNNSMTGEISAESSANSSRRQSLDVLWNSGTGERVKELLNQGMMMLNISNLTERRSSDSRILDDAKDKAKNEKTDRLDLKGKKVPSPLERTMNYLNAEDETSDSESLASVEMLTEDQISSLMMEPDMNQVCQEILGTPLVEVCPLLQQLQQQQ